MSLLYACSAKMDYSTSPPDGQALFTECTPPRLFDKLPASCCPTDASVPLRIYSLPSIPERYPAPTTSAPSVRNRHGRVMRQRQHLHQHEDRDIPFRIARGQPRPR